MFVALPPSAPPLAHRVEVSAFEAEAARLRPMVQAVVAAVLGLPRAHPDVEDCTHEALRRAIEGKDRVRAGEPVGPWAAGIARHVALDARRGMRRARQRAELPRAHAPESTPAVEAAPDPAPGPYERFAGAEERERVLGAVAALPEGPRRALTLFHVEGLSYAQIAAVMTVPLGTVATWVARGRAAVAAAVGKEES
jgi:RNA polymerase sigma-70 factor (ECF subfamily)